MEIKDFLQTLYKFGIEKNYFEIKELGKLDKSCCQNSKIEVIDFDKTKDIISSEKAIPSDKSCDAIKFIIENERIDFIELKGLKMYLELPGRKNFNKSKDINSQISEKITSFKIAKKIKDSIIIIQHFIEIINEDDIDNESFKSVMKNFLIVTDINARKNGLESIISTLEVLSEISTPIESICLKIFEDEIENTDFPNEYNIQKPIPLTCETFLNFYSN
ncbi:MAG: hypothetical protein PHC28_14470 [Flavobacterium sp.]|uniref:hypothetical protein n=1 Tax=Flavobacterium sp. TaxID=239 RepID=UPI00262A8280|nr:hypothetical protein [Flavobacterium sp.]MDD5151659.1 hypothetical protein [Flavobacterium sp.]